MGLFIYWWHIPKKILRNFYNALIFWSNRLFYWDECTTMHGACLNYVHSSPLHCLHTCIAWVAWPSKGLTREWQLRLGAGHRQSLWVGWVMWMGNQVTIEVPSWRQWRMSRKKAQRPQVNIQEGKRLMIIKLRKYNEIGELLIETETTGLQGHVCYWDRGGRVSVTTVAVCMGRKEMGVWTWHRGTYSWSLSQEWEQVCMQQLWSNQRSVSLKIRWK